jgi:adenylate cyclase
MPQERRLAAILVADVVGFSRLVGADETGTLARLAALRRDVTDPLIAGHGGRVFKQTGDGLLVEFASAVQAVTCARAIQAKAGGGPLSLRIGIHLGDVIVQGDDLLGDGVNIAARLEGIAEPGGIALSRQVHDQVRDRLDAAFEDRGEIELKNIARPVHVFALGDRAAPPTSAPVLALPDKPSIAVLPFQNMSGDPEQEYFTDGIVEDIITELSRFRELFVIARNSSFTYKGKAVDIRQVGRELGVRYVLEGSSRKAGDRVRVTAQLIDCESGSHLWAERYDRNLADVFAVQEEITRGIVAQIAPAIEASAHARTRRARPESLSAHELAIRAWVEADAAYAAADPALRDRTMALAQQALALDPDCVLAWVVLGFLAWQADFYSDRERSEEMCRPGFDAVRRAIELDRNEHRAFVMRGLLHVELRRHHDALADLRHACELNPNDARTLQALAFAELMNGEAMAAKNHGLESLRLNPRDPTRYNTTSFLANACFFAGEYAEGLKWIEESKRERPGFPPTIMTAIKLHVGLGQLDRARAEAALVRSPAVEARLLRGGSLVRRPEDRERDIRFQRIGFGLDPPPAAASEPALPLPDKPSIAVLPFLCPGGTAEQEAFADGITESLITDLSRQNTFTVVARTTSFALKGKATDVREIARTLGVRYVLEGSIQPGRGRLRINVQLISALDGIHLWADRFDKQLGDLLDLQDEIAERTSRAVNVQVRDAEIRRATEGARESRDPATLILLGRRIFTQGFCRANALQAAAVYADAVRIDERNASAHAALSIAKTCIHMSRFTDTPEADLAEAVRHCDRARSLDPSLAYVQVAAAWILVATRKYAAALAAFEKVAQAAPIAGGNAFANLALAKNGVGRSAEAEADLLRVIRVTPSDPQMDIWYWFLGMTYICLNRYPKAVEAFRTSISLTPEFDFPHVFLAAVSVALGRMDEARAAIGHARALGTRWTIRTIKAAPFSGIGVGIDDARIAALWDGLRQVGFPQ